jgi:hypothetical protein
MYFDGIAYSFEHFAIDQLSYDKLHSANGWPEGLWLEAVREAIIAQWLDAGEAINANLNLLQADTMLRLTDAGIAEARGRGKHPMHLVNSAVWPR